MAKKTRQNLVEREKNKKGDGTISKVQLWSCYAASALIVVLCVLDARLKIWCSRERVGSSPTFGTI